MKEEYEEPVTLFFVSADLICLPVNAI
jgi:hypothetical protein